MPVTRNTSLSNVRVEFSRQISSSIPTMDANYLNGSVRPALRLLDTELGVLATGVTGWDPVIAQANALRTSMQTDADQLITLIAGVNQRLANLASSPQLIPFTATTSAGSPDASGIWLNVVED